MADTYPSGLAQARQRLAESQKKPTFTKVSLTEATMEAAPAPAPAAAPVIDLGRTEPDPAPADDPERHALVEENRALRAENERLRQALRQARDATSRALED